MIFLHSFFTTKTLQVQTCFRLEEIIFLISIILGMTFYLVHLNQNDTHYRRVEFKTLTSRFSLYHTLKNKPYIMLLSLGD